MSDLVITQKENLVSIADAIREKAGIEDGMSFPDGFVESLDKIELPNFEYTYGTVLFAENLTIGNTLEGAYTIEHGLGKKPNIFIFSYCQNVSYSDTNHLKLCTYLRMTPNIYDNRFLSVQYDGATTSKAHSVTGKYYGHHMADNTTQCFDEATIDDNVVKIIGANDKAFLNNAYNKVDNYGYFWIAMYWDILN